MCFRRDWILTRNSRFKGGKNRLCIKIVVKNVEV